MTQTSVGDGGDDSNTGSSSLFQGKQFWLSQNIPQRSRFRDLIQQHGGVIRLSEKDAEIKLVDHARKNLPADTYSYRYVELSIRNGRLERLEDHRAGPSAARPVGATNIPSRGHRLLYTLQDDQFLWDRMQEYESIGNAPIRGNRIYEELAAENPRHTFQSYRDRYLKRLRGRPRPGGPVTQGDNHRTLPPPAAASTSEARPQPEPQPAPQSPPESTPQSAPQPEIPQKSQTEDQRPGDKKRKRTPEHSTPEHEPSSVDNRAQKKRATGSGAQSPAAETDDSQRSQSPDRQQTPRKSTTPPNETHVTQSPKTNNAEEVAHLLSSEFPVGEPDTTIDNLFLELPFFPGNSESEEPEEPPEQDIDTWIDDRLRTGKAENEEQIIEALRCTSMDPQLADKVLEYLVAGKDIPEDMAGVWTPEDDKCVEGKESRDIERVLNKHGPEYFNSRWEYLGMARSAGFEEGAQN